jgi:hypothetical protein
LRWVATLLVSVLRFDPRAFDDVDVREVDAWGSVGRTEGTAKPTGREARKVRGFGIAELLIGAATIAVLAPILVHLLAGQS